MMSWQSRPPFDCPTNSPATQNVARVRGDSVNQLIIDALAAEIERVRSDNDFAARAKKLLERDRSTASPSNPLPQPR
jgi:hypothetical protein